MHTVAMSMLLDQTPQAHAAARLGALIRYNYSAMNVVLADRSFAPAAARAIYSGIGFIPAVLYLVVELAIRTVFVSSVLWAILVLLSDAITRLDVASHIDAAFRCVQI